MDIKNDHKLESKIEYKNDFKQKTNQLNKEDTNKLENLKSNQLNSKNQSNLEDEIPLIDDGIEDLNDQLKIKSTNNQQTNNDINNDLIKTINHSLTDDCKEKNINQDNQEQNYKLTVGGLDQCHLQMINNLQEFKLNEDELNDTTDLNQLDSVELNQADEQEEKERLIQQVIELRNTLDDLSNRINNVREQSFKLTNENNVLNQYVENLMAASSVFQSTTTTTPTSAKRRIPRK